jgi:RTX calcium-binding nonapeptide repeat (4 copies)
VACFEVLVARDPCKGRRGCVVVRRGHLIAVVVTFLIGCAFLLLAVGCAGTSSESSKMEQEPTEATKKEQTRSPEATASEEAQCQGTRPFLQQGVHLTTNDLPDCPKGGPLLGTDKADKLGGKEGDDEIRGLGAADQIFGGAGNDVIYAGPGNDFNLTGDDGDDVIYVGMAAISFSTWGIGSATSSIAAKARTNTPLTRTTSCRPAARRRPS